MARTQDICQWAGPVPWTSGDGDGRAGEPEDRRRGATRGVVMHIAEGTYAGTIAWQRQARSAVSSTWVCGRNPGEAAQLVDTDDRPWTQGQGNQEWTSIEFAGFRGDRLTDWQIEFAARVLAWQSGHYGHPIAIASNPLRDFGLGHHSMGAENGINWGHSLCPGPLIVAQKPLVIARALDIVGGETMKLWFVRTATDPRVYRTADRVVRTRVPDENTLDDAIYQAHINGDVVVGGGVLTVDNLDAFGTLVGPDA